MMTTLRKYLIAGLLVWVPLAATVVIIKLVIDMMDMILLLFPEQYHPDKVWGFTLPGTGLLLALLILLVTGFLAANLIGRRLVHLWEHVLGRIPLVRNIYNAFKQITRTVLASDNKSFRKVVLIEFPTPGLWSVCFLTNEGINIDSKALLANMCSVFVPTTPIPTTGFNIILPKDKVIELDITIEEAFRMIMSMGVVMPDRQIREILAAATVAKSAPAS